MSNAALVPKAKFCFGIACVVLVTIWLLPGEPRLLDHAKRYVNLGSYAAEGVYCWTTKSEIVSISGKHEANRIDTISGKVTLQPRLTSFIRSLPASTCEPTFSPDGKWIALQGRDSNEWIAFRLDGSSSLSWKGYGGGQGTSAIIWTSNSRNFIVIPMDYNGPPDGYGPYVCKLESPGEAGWHRLSDDHNIMKQVIAVKDHSGHSTGTFLWPLEPSNSLVLTAIDLDTPPSSPNKELNMRLPFKADVASIAFSPNGNQILWALERHGDLDGPIWIQQLLKKLGTRGRFSVDLWVSDADGQSFQEVGYIPRKPDDISLEGVRWTLDGHNASFIFQNALYLVPIH